MGKSIGLVIGAVVVVAAVVGGTILFRAGTPDDTTSNVPLTEAVETQVGAATKVPDDVSLFIGLHDLGPRLRTVWQSNAMRKIINLPGTQMLWRQMQQSPDYHQAMAMLRSHPLAVQGLPILQDGASREIFIAAGPELVDLNEAVIDISNTIQAASIRADMQNEAMGEPPFDPKVVVDAILKHEAVLKTPSILIGMNLSDPQAAQRFLDDWLTDLQPAPNVRIEKQTIHDVEFHVLKLSGADLPEMQIQRMADDLEREGIPAEDRQRLIDFIRGQRLFVAAGVLDNYLLLSIGSDQGLLKDWSPEASLAAGADFAPLRANLSGPLFSVGYASERLAYLNTWKPSDLRDLARVLVNAIPPHEVPPGLTDRLLSDIDELADALPEPAKAPILAFTQINRGLEGFVYFPKAAVELDDTEALNLLTHRGKAPLGWTAAHARPTPGAYDELVKWLRRGYGYFEDYGIPEMAPDERAEFEQVMTVVKPYLATIDATNRDHLIPALDGAPSLIVLDGGGRIERLPGEGPLNPAVPIPRIGIAVDLNDPTQFITGVREYVEATNTLLGDLSARFPDEVPAAVRIPEPRVTDLAGGKFYFYPLPEDLGLDARPGALLKDDLLVLTTSSRLAEEMAGSVDMPTGDVVELDQPAGSATYVQIAESAAMLHRMLDAVRLNMLEQGAIGPGEQRQMAMAEMHVDAIVDALGAVRTYSSRTTNEGDRTVTHTWLHLQDIAP